ncbi:Isoquinoline 1-oxidoreductase beta subunit [Pacificimonas flava]|uniref:Isoquinoline 1-oxidoreductase beta subunit n=2 Tax=Pacificimonas flava TaxID=1234595 RepID=M2U1F7_9SPHN|nr:Isoquinoline 1-oxidoreductase beta subunit [Pacificimonas flava]
MNAHLSRREMIAGGGLVVLFALGPQATGQGGGVEGQANGEGEVAPGLPGSLGQHPVLDSWIRVAADGQVTVFTGKAELGQGIKTAIVQLAADELDIGLDRLTLVTADTHSSPDEGLTAGSHSMEDSGTAVANAAANVRHLLAEQTARLWDVPVASLSTRNGQVTDGNGRTLDYGAIAANLSLHVPARLDIPRKPIGARRLIGKHLPRIDIPAKLTGGTAYVHDMKLPGMLHARVVRGPAEGTQLIDPDVAAMAGLPGVDRVVSEGRFIALLGRREWPLVQALRILGQLEWERPGEPIPTGDRAAVVKGLSPRVEPILDRQDESGGEAVRWVAARYTRPWLMHGAIGPSCAVALLEDGIMTIWTHSQGVNPLRGAIAEMLGMPPERVRCVHVEGSGCYGHNGADDVAADAALAARAVPGRPVRMLWSREQEHGWEPLGPAQVVELRGGLDAVGRIIAWNHQVWSNTHVTRPSRAGDLIAAQELGRGFTPASPRSLPQPEGGGDRNSIPLYALANARVTKHFLQDMPLRVSAIRSLGAHMNVFAIESFMDELALATRSDPVAFRLRHMADMRARTVIERTADRFAWGRRTPGTLRGHGFAFARYKNLGAFCAIAMDVEVLRDSGRVVVHRAVASVDSGDIVNPDGIRNQIEGGILQSISWTGHEAVAYDERSRTSYDWSVYPILRFEDVPLSVEVDLVDRPGQPFLGTGEAAQGPAAAAYANAIAAATGRRLREMPLTDDAIRTRR